MQRTNMAQSWSKRAPVVSANPMLPQAHGCKSALYAKGETGAKLDTCGTQ
jgi:hypothetical protein